MKEREEIEVYETSYGYAKIIKQEKPEAAIVMFDDKSTITIERADAPKLNLAPHTLPHTPSPSHAAAMLEDMRDLCALEIEYCGDQQAIVKGVWGVLGIVENDSTRQQIRPFDWSKEGFKRRIARRKF